MSSQTPPVPTWLYRLVHVANLSTLLTRGALHAPNCTPNDGLPYRTIHNVSVQASRRVHIIPCGPGGSTHDYVPFYFGPLSPMLLNLKTGRVPDYDEDQAPLIYLVTSLEAVQQAACRFVFSDGHGLAGFTIWYADPANLDQVDLDLAGERYWADTANDNDRQRRKQAEFLVWRSVDWSLIQRIGVFNAETKAKVKAALTNFPQRHQPQVAVKSDWYYY